MSKQTTSLLDSSPAIEFHNVTLNYGGDDVVKSIDFKIEKNETKVILGPSGVGKSTILKAILGLLMPSVGSIKIFGRDTTLLSERELLQFRQRMSMVFQGGALFDSMTVSHNVSYRLRELALMTPKEIDTRVNEVLQFVGLQGAKKLYPSQLSGGMKKRVAIARALAPDPEIFLFDEPTSGLDPLNTFNTEQLILRLKQKKGSSAIIVTHDVESALLLADSIVMLHEGKFIFEGTAKEIVTSKDERVQAFLNPREYYAQK